MAAMSIFFKTIMFNLSSKAFMQFRFLPLHLKASTVCFTSVSKHFEGKSAFEGIQKPRYTTSESDNDSEEVAHEMKEKAKGKMKEGVDKTKENTQEMKENTKEKTQQAKEKTKERANEMKEKAKRTAELFANKAKEMRENVKETIVGKGDGDHVRELKKSHGWEVKDEDDVDFRFKAGGIELDDYDNDAVKH